VGDRTNLLYLIVCLYRNVDEFVVRTLIYAVQSAHTEAIRIGKKEVGILAPNFLTDQDQKKVMLRELLHPY
jgi:hypothetical protein